MKKLQKLENKKLRLLTFLKELEKQIAEEKSETLITCNNCKASHKIKNLVYIQTFWKEDNVYTVNYNKGEGQWYCSNCLHKNSLYDNAEVVALKPYFKSVKDVYEK